MKSNYRVEAQTIKDTRSTIIWYIEAYMQNEKA